MSSMFINFTQDIKKKWFYIKVKGFVIQKKFCEQT